MPEEFSRNSKRTLNTFAKQHIIKKLTNRPPRLFKDTKSEIDDLITCCMGSKDPVHICWKTAIETEHGLEHLQFVVHSQAYAKLGNGLSCGEPCGVGVACRNHQGEYQGTCIHFKGHDPAVAHSCASCDDYTSSEEDKKGLKRSIHEGIGKLYNVD